MPCTDGRERDDAIALHNKVNKLTELLCHACQARYPQMSAREAALETELQQWWHEHQRSRGHLRGPRFTIDELKEALAAMQRAR